MFQLEEEPFNPDYVEIDRVLDSVEQFDTATDKSIKHYLAKWRSLPYEDSTWELEEDIDPSKIEQYERFNRIPSKDRSSLWWIVTAAHRHLFNIKRL